MTKFLLKGGKLLSIMELLVESILSHEERILGTCGIY